MLFISYIYYIQHACNIVVRSSLGIVEVLVGSCIVWWGVLGVGMLMRGCGGGWWVLVLCRVSSWGFLCMRLGTEKDRSVLGFLSAPWSCVLGFLVGNPGTGLVLVGPSCHVLLLVFLEFLCFHVWSIRAIHGMISFFSIWFWLNRLHYYLANMFKHYKHINVGYWNVDGLVEKVNNTAFNKLSDIDFVRVIKRMDLFCLSETHVGPDLNIALDNYYVYKSCRRISANNRFFGGFCIFISNFISKGMKVIRNNHQGTVWLKLRKDFLKLDKDLYICLTYISPSNSSYYRNNDFDSESVFDLIKQDCAEFIVTENVMIMEDFNAHGPHNSLDFIANDDFVIIMSLYQVTFTALIFL